MGALQGRVFFANGNRNTDHKEYIVSTETEVFMLPTQTKLATGYFEGDTSFDGHAQTGSICFVINKVNGKSEPIIYILDKDGWVPIDKEATGESSGVVTGKLGDEVYFILENGNLTVYGQGGTYDFSSTPEVLADYTENITQINVIKNVTTLGNNVFSGLTNATKANIAETVTSVSYTAFDGDSVEIMFEGKGISDDYNFVLNYPYGTSGDINFENSEMTSTIAIPIGESAYFREYDNKVIVFYGTGATTGGVGSNYTAQDVVVCKGITGFGGMTFANASGYITNFIASEDFVTIGNQAFTSADFRDGFVVPNSVTTIGNQAFTASRLKSITIPSSVTNIGEKAFAGCSSLTTANIQANITTIPLNMFVSCSALKNFDIPNGVTTIGEEAFTGCNSLETVNIPSTVTTISKGAFISCIGLTSIDIPSSVTNIGDYAFDWCNNLTTINIDKLEGTVEGAPWGAVNATINWKEEG